MQVRVAKVNARVKYDYGEEGREVFFVYWQTVEKNAGLDMSITPHEAFCKFLEHKQELLASYKEIAEEMQKDSKHKNDGRIIAIEFFYNSGEKRSGWLYI